MLTQLGMLNGPFGQPRQEEIRHLCAKRRTQTGVRLRVQRSPRGAHSPTELQQRRALEIAVLIQRMLDAPAIWSLGQCHVHPHVKDWYT
jgi:hypothetical protein